MTNMRAMIIDIDNKRLLVVLHNSHPPSDAEWDDYLKECQTLFSGEPGALKLGITFTDGGAPNAKQRAALNALMKDVKLRGVVVTNSALVRGVVTAMSWVNPNIKSFARSDIGGAFAYLGIAATALDKLRDAIQSAREHVKVESTESLLAATDLRKA